jgi:protein SCO1/2
VIGLLIALALPLPATGKPLIVVPMYTRCPTACLTITRNMKKAVAKAGTNSAAYDVMLFSFDPRDRDIDMQAFAKREKVPPTWKLATATPSGIQELMDAIGFRYMQSNGGFEHPSVAAVFDSKGKFVKTLPANALDIDGGIAAAQGRRDWIADYGGIALAILLLVCALSAIYLLTPRERTQPC